MAVNAFKEFMTSTEDLLGWLFALQEWQSGEAESSLFILLIRLNNSSLFALTSLLEYPIKVICHFP